MKTIFFLILASTLTLIDQGIKTVVRKYPSGRFPFRLGPFFDCCRTENRGIAFSLLKRAPVLILIITLILSVWLIIFLCTRHSTFEKLCLSVILGGTLGNLIDRLCFGSVTDYLRFVYLPRIIFNFADICIVAGVACYMLFLLCHGE